LSGIRIIYSGLINFIIGLIRIFTGFAFILIVTRLLSPEEFGSWNLIVGLITYVLVFHHVISFWITREIARDETSGKTALFASSIFSVIGISAYIGITYFVVAQTQIQQDILLIASIIIPTQFFYSILTAINLGWKPHVTSYGLIILDVAKIPVAFILLFYYDMGIVGVIISAVVGNIASCILLAIFCRNKIRGVLNRNFLKKWTKLSWLPLFPSSISIISAFDVLVFTIIVGTTEGVGYYSAALVIAGLGSYASLISIGVYPKLLGEKNREYLQNTLTVFLYFLIPLGLISIAFAKPGLYALNPTYEIISIAVIFLTFKIILSTIFSVFSQFLKGIEKVDTRISKFSEYRKSMLFYLPTLQLIKFSSYIGLLVTVLILSTSTSFLDLVLYWSIIGFVIQIPFVIIISHHIRKKFNLKLEYYSILKYLFSGIISFGSAFLLANEYLIYTPSIFEFLPNLLLFVAYGIGVYLLLTYFIDSNTKKLFVAIFSNIKT
jgi:O-antigen/teichoic acid export membrane protein